MRRTLVCIVMTILCALPLFADEQVHELRRGETIYTLARRYGVSADVILEYNSIDDPTRLPVGAEIRIPGTYRVLEGEYIYSIARKLGVDWQELLRSNGLSATDVVRPGDTLLVPAGSASAAVVADRASGSSTDSHQGSGADQVSGAAAVSGGAAAGTAATSTVTSTGTSTGTSTVRSTLVSAARLVWPHPGEREAFDGRFPGVSMLGEAGDEFRSVTTGVVQFVGPFSSFGKLILVRAENGYLYGYSGADRVDVELGQEVTNGTVLGSVGFSPAFQSARVLFTVWRNNRYIDPETAPRG